MGQVLSGVKVLDLTHYVSGPYCTQLLSEFGAEVLKIERPGSGDGSRSIGPFNKDEPEIEKSGLFLLLNTGKKSLTLNLKSETGRNIFLKLAETSDIIVENFAPGVMEKLGLAYQNVVKVNPRIIMASISNFGQDGPYRDWKATEMILLALSGVMYVTGPFERPVKYGLYQIQYMAAVEAASSILASYFSRERNADGSGDYLDVPIVEALKNYVNNHGSYFSYMGAIRGRLAKIPDMIDMILPTKDGYVAPVFFGYVDWGDFCRMLDYPELDKPKFSDAKSRRAHRKELLDLLTRRFLQLNKFDLVSLAQEWRFSFGAVQTAEDILNNAHLKDRDFFVEIEHPQVGKLTYPGVPFKMTESPMRIQGRAPLLGEHNEEILCHRLGYSREDLIKMQQSGII